MSRQSMPPALSVCLITMTVGRIFTALLCSAIAFAQDIDDQCTFTNTGKQGTCKLLSDCPSAEEQAKNGLSLTICGFLHHSSPIVCCEGGSRENRQGDDRLYSYNGKSETDSFVYPDSLLPFSESNRRKFGLSERKCEEYSNSTVDVVQAIALVPHSEPISISVVKCDFDSLPLIVGGSPALPGEFPFMAAVGYRVDNEIKWRCGGTLISERFILTAAHCTSTRDAGPPSVVRLGDLDLTRTDDGSKEVDYEIGKIIVHPEYRYPQKYNDIALLKTKYTVELNKYVRPACLNTKRDIGERKAVAMGWGKTDYAAAETNNKLLKVVLNIYNNDYCSQTYRSDGKLPDGIRGTMLCAGERKGGKDTCQGDSGGPLIITHKDNNCKFYVVGVTSFGKFCGGRDIPAVYTRVSDYVSWIESIVW